MEEIQPKKSKSRKRSLPVRVARALLWVLMSVLLLLIVCWISLNVYLQSNKEKIFENVAFLNGGTVSFAQAELKLFRDFPDVSLIVQNFHLHDARFAEHQRPAVQLGKVTAIASLRGILNNEILVNSLRLEDGEINYFTDKSGYSNLKSLFEREKAALDRPDKDGLKIQTGKFTVNLSNVAFHVDHAIKQSSIHGVAKEVLAELQLEEKGMKASLDFQVDMEELSFKKENGSYVPDSKLAGKVDLELVDGIVNFGPFDLAINEEHFQFSGRYDTQKTTRSMLSLENHATNLPATVPLLPPALQTALLPYQIAHPFYSKTTIEGSFERGDLPLVTVAFKFYENDVTVQKSAFKQVTTTGKFVNRIYADERKWAEGKKRVRVELENLRTRHNGFSIQSEKVLVTATPETGALLLADAQVQGATKHISEWFRNDKFFFRNGNFQLQAQLQGPLDDYEAVLLASSATMQLHDFSVTYKPGDVTFPFKKMKLQKKPGRADFTILSSTLENGNDFLVDGGMTNFEVLLVNMAGKRASSEVMVKADKIGWSDFINLFGEHGYLNGDGLKSDREKKQSMKQTIRGIQFSFQPRLAIEVDTLEYFDLLAFHRFRSGVHFEGQDVLVLEKTRFEYEGAQVDFQGRLDISQPNLTPFEFELHTNQLNLQKLLPPLDYFGVKLLADFENLPQDVDVYIRHRGVMDDELGLIPNTSAGQIQFSLDNGRTLLGSITYTPSTDSAHQGQAFDKRYVNTHIVLEGDPALMNEFFENDEFFFDEGRFYANFDYQGDMRNVGELLNECKADFIIEQSQVYYKTADITFPLTSIYLVLENDKATFEAQLNADSLQYQLSLQGWLDNLSGLLLDNTGKQVHTTVNVYSPKLEWEEFADILAPKEAERTPAAMKSALQGILLTFDPTLQVQVDTFVYSKKLVLHEVGTGMCLIDSTILVLDNTSFRFHDGSMQASGHVDLGQDGVSPFEAKFSTDDLDAARLLETLDYLSFPALQNMEELAGRVTMNLDLAGIIDEEKKGLVSEATSGSLDFDLRNVQLKGLAPLTAVAKKAWMGDRFDEVRFAPLVNHITIHKNEMYIPMMEIQSNAVHLFVEGVLSQGNESNIWVSVPLHNLRRSEVDTIPDMQGYAASGRKVFIEMTSDEHGENRFKFHLSKRKFFKQRGILPQYKIEKKRHRQLRRKLKKGN